MNISGQPITTLHINHAVLEVQNPTRQSTNSIILLLMAYYIIL